MAKKTDYLIFGGSGQTGSELVKCLCKNSDSVRVCYREQADLNTLRVYGAEPIYASYDDSDSILEALKGVSAAALILPVHPKMGEWGETVIDCARRARLSNLVVLSNLGADKNSPAEIGRMHGSVISCLHKSGVPGHVVQCAPYFQNLLWSVITVVRQRKFSLPLENAKLPYIDLGDVAAFIAKLLSGDVQQPDRAWRVTGAHSYSMFDIARKMSETLGYKIRYMPVPPNSGKTVFRSQGLTSWLSEAIAGMYAEYASGKFDEPAPADFEKVMGRPPAGLDEFIEKHINVFRRNTDAEHMLIHG